MREVLEIRVHGVANTSPEAMLRERGSADPEVRLCAGDEQTGFYRRRGDRDDATVVTEAYSWGQLTSGSRAKKDVQRAGWALLLPFALVNVALWARPDVSRSRRARTAAYLVRLLAVSLTVAMTTAAAEMAMDEFGWQCRDGCPRGVPGTALLRENEFWHSGLRPVGFLMLVPALAATVVWLLARRSFSYEAEIPATPPTPAEPASPLERRFFWSGDTQVRRLAKLHLAAGLATPAGLGTLAAWKLDGPDPFGVAAATLTLVTFAVILYALAEREIWVRQPAVGGGADGTVAIVTALLAFVGAALYLVVPARAHLPGPPAPLTGFGAVAQGLFIGQFAVVLLLGALVNNLLRGVAVVLLVATGVTLGATGTADDWSPRRVFLAVLLLTTLTAAVALIGRFDRDREFNRPLWAGRSSAFFGGLGVLAGTFYSAAGTFWLAEWLNGSQRVTRDDSQVHIPVSLLWTAAGLFTFALPLVVAAGLATLSVNRLRRTAQEGLLTTLPDAPGNAHKRRRALDVAAAIATNRFIGEKTPMFVGWLGAVLVLWSVVGVAGSATGLTPAELITDSGVRPILEWFTDAGSVLTGLLMLVLAAVVGLAYRRPGPRRTLGVIWDLATFWPRGAHPFAPPSYGERVVPQLLTRICGTPGRAVVLAGHSQGSLLVAATVFQLPRDRQREVYLLTFGSQLTRLYGRLFPAFFGPAARHRLADVLRDDPAHVRWRNLYRETDYLGWPIGTPAGLDVPVQDPEGLAPTGGEVLDPPIRRHSDYPCSLAYQHARRTAVRALWAEPNGLPASQRVSQPAVDG
ncbi:hypothetical protein [Paractinoplanes lichenicola]|uniref:Integral membrane protein n=1 Tax=Paractinoplanes lichenicola TaxID=2802976 RepID=A0ABS1VH94_9ACTN|nr:hypothetical protein [Actinoplanes lichenicola]MBL7253514.1 hypothetical protein [Actinoplanes lichenicola]